MTGEDAHLEMLYEDRQSGSLMGDPAEDPWEDDALSGGYEPSMYESEPNE